MGRFFGWWSKVPRKVKYVLWTLVTYAVKSQWPDAPLPGPEWIGATGGALLAGHVITDAAAAFKRP